MSNVPTISVLMIAYNHERYAEQAVRSVLDQQVAAEIEIVIGEDCSTDNTREVLERMRRQAPDKIRVLRRERNLGFMPNYIETYHACRGEFVATLSCDDYWTDPRKLQKQLDAMQQHVEWSLCFHRALFYLEDAAQGLYVHPDPDYPRDTTFAQIVRRNVIYSPTAMLRRSRLPRLPEWFRELDYEDWALYSLLAATGPIGFLPDDMAVYRRHAASMTTQRSAEQEIRSAFKMYDLLSRHVGESPEHQAALKLSRDDFALALGKDLDVLRQQYREIQTCASYRLGVALTAPARWLLEKLGLRRTR